MKHFYMIFALILSAASLAVEPPPLPKFDDSATFYISFDDETINADIAVGREIPIVKLGKISFAEGIRGKALLCGKNGARIRFQRKGHLNFDKPGTLVFFYKGAFKSMTSGPRVFFWGIESSKGYIGQQLSNDPKTVCPCKRELHTMFLNGKRIRNNTLFTKLTGGEKGCETWHMLAFSWAPGQLSIKFDKDAAKAYPIPFDMNESDFPSNEFSIGSHTDWEYYLDEFIIYDRRLSDAELDEIYNQFIK